MNRVFTATFFLLFICQFGVTQKITANTYLEQTHVSPKIGTSVGYRFGTLMELGGFLQKSTEELEAPEGRPMIYENEFFGAYFTYPVVAGKKADLRVKVRTGVSNRENFVITPSLHANYSPISNLSFGAGIGTRAFRPTVMASIAINLNSKQAGRSYLAGK